MSDAREFVEALRPFAKPAKISEAQLSKYIFDLLSTDGWHVFRMEPISRREWGKGTGEIGQPDLLAIRYLPRGMCLQCAVAWTDFPPTASCPQCGESLTVSPGPAEVLWCEVKRKGAKAQANQLAWIEAERRRGALIWLAGVDFDASPEGFFEKYKASGLMRKEIR